MRYYIIRREEPFEKGTEELKYSFSNLDHPHLCLIYKQ